MRQAPPQGHGGAERAFLEGRTAEAAQLWKAALADPECEHEGAIEFNLGLAASRLGKHAEALWHFRRAELRLPDQPQVIEQRAGAQRALGDPAHVAETNHLEAGSAWCLLILAALLEALGAILLCSRRSGTKSRWILPALALLIGLGLGASVFCNGLQSDMRMAVVLEATVVHDEPVAAARVQDTLAPGTNVRVLAVSDRWAHISSPRGTGYVERHRLGLVD